MSTGDDGRGDGHGPAMNGYDVTIHDLAGSYAVHALTGTELSEFEAHLHDCARCRAEVRGFAEALAELSGELAVAPPAAVRSSVLAAITGVAQLAPPEPGELGRPRHAAAPVMDVDAPAAASATAATAATAARGPSPAPAEQPAADVPVAPPARELDEVAAARERRESRRTGRPTRGRAWIAVAAAAAVIAVGAGGWAVNLNRQLDRNQHSQVAGQQVNQRESALLNASDAKILSTRLNDGTPVSYVVSKKLNTAMLVGANVRSPGADKVWQLWTVGSAGPSRDQTFTAGTDLRVFMTGDIDTSAALAVTIEKAGSTPKAPTMAPFAVVKV